MTVQRGHHASYEVLVAPPERVAPCPEGGRCQAGDAAVGERTSDVETVPQDGRGHHKGTLTNVCVKTAINLLS